MSQNRGFSPAFRVLSDDKIRRIQDAALVLLESTGISFEGCTEALGILSDIGADVSEPGRVKIPARLVEHALALAPKAITIYDRSSNPAFTLNGSSATQFGGSVGGPNYADPFTGQSRPCYVQDIEDLTRLIDGLDNISWIMTCPSHPTVPGELGDLMSLLHIMLNTTKPIGLTINSLWGLKEMLHASALVAGGEDALRERPFILGSSEPVTPLSQEPLAMQSSLLCAEKGIPNIVYSMPMAGSTAPATFAAALALACAETLSQLVVVQHKRPGTPVVLGSIPNIMDMRTMVFPYGAPELAFLVAALTEVVTRYGLPMFGTAGCTDAATVDCQVGAEVTGQIVMALLSGAELVHDVGVMSSGKIFSPELHVLVDELVDFGRTLVQPFDVDDETLALGLIDRVGPGGNFLAEEHTLRHFRGFWAPRTFDRYANKSGRKDCGQRVNERARKLIQTHEPVPLADAMVAELTNLERHWFEHVGCAYPYPQRP